jgi:hypothetical protein
MALENSLEAGISNSAIDICDDEDFIAVVYVCLSGLDPSKVRIVKA